MTITQNQKPDAARFAKDDLASNYNKWHEAERKPGEVKIVKHFRDRRSHLISQKKTKERELLLKEKELEYAREFNTSDSNRQERENNIKTEIAGLDKELELLRIELQKVEAAITRLKIKNPQLKKQAVDSEVASTPIKVKNNWFLKYGKSILLMGMLIFISGFDAYNMYASLDKFDHDPTKYQILCSFIFCAVLYTSYNLKKHNTPILWIGFLLFVTVANIPQFLGRNPVFGISNLLNSPSHMIVFVISFFGSIIITVSNQLLSKHPKTTKNSSAPEAQLPTDSQVSDNIQFSQLLKKRGDLSLRDGLLLSKKAVLQKQLEDMARNSEDMEKATIDGKLKAIQQLDEEHAQLQMEVEKIQVQVDDLPEEMKDSIQEYRQEIEIMQLINNYPSTVNYYDINSFTI